MNILIKNAKVVDGTGNPWFCSDIEIEDGKIKQMERKLAVKADRTIDAEGLVVAPGFVDPHCHNDGPIVFHPDMDNYITQGVTTGVLGLCGTSPFPDKETYLSLLSQVYGGDVFWYSKEFAKSDYDWHSLSDYSSLVMSRRPAVNVAPLIGLGTILWKVGYRASTEKEARRLTAEEIKGAKDLIRQGFEQGAIALSTSRDYFPDRYLVADDYIEPLKVVAEYNRPFFPHTRLLATPDGLKEALEIVRKTGVRMHISHLNVTTNWGWGYGSVNRLPECLGILDTAREEGIDVTFDVIQNMSYCFRLDSLLRQFRYFCREWADKPLEGVESFEQFRNNCQRPEYRAEVREIVTNYIGRAEQYLSGMFAEHLDMTILIKTGDKKTEGKTLGKIAKEQGLNPRDLFFDIAFGVSPLVANCPHAVEIWPFTAGHPNEENVVKATNHPLGMPSSDYPILATPVEYYYSPSAYATASYYYEKAKDYGVRLEEVIRKLTSLPAQVLGLKDRGMLREGMKADIVIFDPEDFRAGADYYNPEEKAPGVSYVLVNGRVVLDNGELTEERPGEVLLLKSKRA
ncbi:amidohydrolase family protein [Chloroflexota bacterium]